VKDVIRCIFEEPRISIVGFDLRQDLERLYKMFPDVNPPLRENVLDVQKMSMNVLKPKKGKEFKQPSLKETCEYWLGHSIDKAEQCSNWTLRPLSDSQITYAGLDAIVVLELLKKFQSHNKDEPGHVVEKSLKVFKTNSHATVGESHVQSCRPYAVAW